MSDDEIELVVITGAGASYPFGAPLMTGWCDALVSKLSLASGYLQATGLRADLAPEDFEDRLGRFLHAVQAFDQIKDLVPSSVDFQPVSASLSAQGVLAEWHRTTAIHLHQIVAKIRESLYDLFAAVNLQVPDATSAYRHLFAILGIDVSTSPWLYATTNYDVLAETVIAGLGGRPDWGELPELGYSGERRLDVDHLIDAIPRSTPVLHLHGRVGWYRRPDGTVYASSTTKHNEGYGVPVVMLPDLNKTYGEDAIINSLWTQFADALSCTKRVFILGHSLHDEALTQAVRRHVLPERVMVSVLSDDRIPKNPASSAEPVLHMISEFGWRSVPMRFGSSLETARPVISSWLNDTAD